MNGNGHAQIISLLGGGKKLTARLKSLTEENVNEKTVYSWVQQGIPDRWKVAVARCLLEDNIEITKYKELLPPGITIDNLTAANNSIKIFSDSKVLKATEKEIISNIDKNLALNIYQLMLKVRRFEEKVGQLYSMGLIGGFCHLYIGQEGIISGVGLDVFDSEPVEKNHFLFKYKQVIFTPHQAGLSQEAAHRMSIKSINNILDYYDGSLDSSLIVNGVKI